jgi:hypothetical protein
VVREWLPEVYDEQTRTWSSGPELIRLAEAGCDLCAFIREHLEKVSTANVRRIADETAIVLPDCYSEITLSLSTFVSSVKISKPWYFHAFEMKRTPINTQFSVLETPYNPVLRACELLETCVLGANDGHGDCEPGSMDLSTKAISLPRRLLDLSHHDSILTLDVQTWIATARATVEELSKYCTLSYRWGERPPSCMLSTQFAGERVISFTSMPQTFKDVIIVARGLKIRFIWIDALCIIQPSAYGDYADWNAEGPRMWLVYQNAICTIAATCSTDPNNGFLWKVGTDNTAPCSVPGETNDGTVRPLVLCSMSSAFHNSVISSSLNRRGWVAQEQLLSRRVLHFSEEGVFWQCQAIDPTDTALRWEVGGGMGSKHASSLTLEKWLHFIEFYSASEFTHSTDRLIALLSIAKSVPDERFGTTYFAGIWGAHLLTCLSWQSVRPCSAISRASCLAIAPSWSWASVPSRIQYPASAFSEPVETWMGSKDEILLLAEPSNSSRNFEGRTLELHARLCSMPLSTDSQSDLSLPTDGQSDLPLESFDFFDLAVAWGTPYWDESQDHSVADRIYTVVPLSISFFEKYSRCRYSALIVTLLPSTGDDSPSGLCRVYRRIGYVEWQCYSGNIGGAGNTAYERPDHESLVEAFFPNATQETILLV